MPIVSQRRRTRRALASRRGLVQITLTAVLWGTGGVVVELLHDGVGLSPMSIAFYRLAVGAVVLLVATTRRTTSPLTILPNRPALLLVTGIGLAAYQALYFVAVTDIGVSVATMISIGVAPILITAYEATQARRFPTFMASTTVIVATIGLVLVTLGAADSGVTSGHRVAGLLCAAGSGVGYAATTVLSRRATVAVSALQLTAITTTVGAAVLAPLAMISGLRFQPRVIPLLELAYLGPMTTSLAFVLFYLGLRTTPTSTAAVITLLEPLAAAILSVAVLGDALPASTIVGGGLMIGAIAALYVSQPLSD
jgi:drug/metabolite transporter (DMT)-like permease